MKFQQKDFNEKLKGEIKKTEVALKDHIEELITQNKPVFVRKGLDFDAAFDREGNDPFQPGYCSSVSIGIADVNEELTDLHMIKIWECDRYFLGMPISIKIPGSRIVGELLDESLEDIKQELKEYIVEVLEEVNGA